MVDLTNIKSLGIDIETALASLDKDVTKIKNDEYRQVMYDCLAKALKEHGMLLYSLFKHSRYAPCVASDHPLSTIDGIASVIDAVEGMVYDILDDGEFHLVKVETVGAKHPSFEDRTKFEPDLSETVKWLVWNSDIHCTYDAIKNVFDDEFIHSVFSDDPDNKYDSLKITHCFVNLERFKKIFQLLDEHKARREKYIDDFCKKVGMPRDKYSFSVGWKGNEKLYEMQHEAWFNEPELDLTGVTDDWHVHEMK